MYIPGRNFYSISTSFVVSSSSRCYRLKPDTSPDKTRCNAHCLTVSSIPFASVVLHPSNGLYFGMSGLVLLLPRQVPKGAFNASPNILIELAYIALLYPFCPQRFANPTRTQVPNYPKDLTAPQRVEPS